MAWLESALNSNSSVNRRVVSHCRVDFFRSKDENEYTGSKFLQFSHFGANEIRFICQWLYLLNIYIHIFLYLCVIKIFFYFVISLLWFYIFEGPNHRNFIFFMFFYTVYAFYYILCSVIYILFYRFVYLLCEMFPIYRRNFTDMK